MNALFDRNCNVVAWMDDKYVFDKNLVWIGFINGDYFFKSDCNWIGGFVNHTIVDKNGKAIAWEEGFAPHSTLPQLIPLRPLKPLNPLRPLQPLQPLRPLRPLDPLGGWSQLSWSDMLQIK
jgi:hypothetical protein